MPHIIHMIAIFSISSSIWEHSSRCRLVVDSDRARTSAEIRVRSGIVLSRERPLLQCDLAGWE